MWLCVNFTLFSTVAWKCVSPQAWWQVLNLPPIDSCSDGPSGTAKQCRKRRGDESETWVRSWHQDCPGCCQIHKALFMDRMGGPSGLNRTVAGENVVMLLSSSGSNNESGHRKQQSALSPMFYSGQSAKGWVNSAQGLVISAHRRLKLVEICQASERLRGFAGLPIQRPARYKRELWQRLIDLSNPIFLSVSSSSSCCHFCFLHKNVPGCPRHLRRDVTRAMCLGG